MFKDFKDSLVCFEGILRQFGILREFGGFLRQFGVY
ncbi:hypothetical protein E2C01_084992 [Portunus trituberculatus]|uniref:Uncharacterized protein n=1 Tax=Portunus trituberculatus TaxID=210409 RepID=A0A5B7J5G6_PORTR|nr:hypothetical protein [Portunus trituberculatus]